MIEGSQHAALRLVETQGTLVLAADRDPCSAPVYYLYSRAKF